MPFVSTETGPDKYMQKNVRMKSEDGAIDARGGLVLVGLSARQAQAQDVGYDPRHGYRSFGRSCAGCDGESPRDNGITRTATSDGQGRYTLPNMPAGKYNIRADATGFVTFTRPDVDVPAGQANGLDIALQIAAESQQVQRERSVGRGPFDGCVEQRQRARFERRGHRRVAGRSGRSAVGSRSSGRSGRRSQRSAVLRRRFQRRPVAAEEFDPRDPHQFEPVFLRVRPSWFRAHRDPHQARHGQLPRPGVYQLRQQSLRQPESAARPPRRPTTPPSCSPPILAARSTRSRRSLSTTTAAASPKMRS